MSPRDIAINQLHASMGCRAIESLERYREAVSDWEVIPITDAGEIIGAILRKGFILHLGVVRPPRGSQRRFIRNVLMTTIAAHGRAVTTVREGHFKGVDFCERLGFTAIETIGELVYLVCERARYA